MTITDPHRIQIARTGRTFILHVQSGTIGAEGFEESGFEDIVGATAVAAPNKVDIVASTSEIRLTPAGASATFTWTEKRS